MRASPSDQRDLAEHAIRALTELEGVSAELRGSLAGGDVDRFSDIDLVVASDSLSDLLLVERVTEKLCACFPILFLDWAKSLLPEKRVISFYLDYVSIFWNVDIDFSVPEDLRDISRDGLSEDIAEHGLKLWCLTLKRLSRRSVIPEKAVGHLYKRFLSEELPPEHTIISAMEVILSDLAKHLPARFNWFLADCRNELRALQSNRWEKD